MVQAVEICGGLGENSRLRSIKYMKMIRTLDIDIILSDFLSSTIMYTQHFTDIYQSYQIHKNTTVEQCTYEFQV